MGGFHWDWLYNPIAIPRDEFKGISNLAGGGKSTAPTAPLPLPAAPNTSKIQDDSQNMINKRRALATQTTFTDPLGIGGSANVSRKILLGN